MELSIVKPGNEAAGTVSVSEATFAREYNEDLVHQVVTSYLAGARQGTRAADSSTIKMSTMNYSAVERESIYLEDEDYSIAKGKKVVWTGCGDFFY